MSAELPAQRPAFAVGFEDKRKGARAKGCRPLELGRVGEGKQGTRGLPTS